MLVTYTLQAILVSCYIPAFLLIRFRKSLSAQGKRSLFRKILFALQHSTPSFLNATFVFAIAMLSASLISVARSFDYQAMTVSATVLTLLMPFSSVSPAVLLHLAASNTLR
jgi:hypothetical protein